MPVTKGALAEALAKETGLTKCECSMVIGSLGGIATQELKGEGNSTLPGLSVYKVDVTDRQVKAKNITEFLLRVTSVAVSSCALDDS